MRSASVNNDCYALCALKVRLHNHVRHASAELEQHITAAVDKFNKQFPSQTFGWESNTLLPKVKFPRSWNNAITVIVLFEQRKHYFKVGFSSEKLNNYNP
jgi:hypothetical protein